MRRGEHSIAHALLPHALPVPTQDAEATQGLQLDGIQMMGRGLRIGRCVLCATVSCLFAHEYAPRACTMPRHTTFIAPRRHYSVAFQPRNRCEVVSYYRSFTVRLHWAD